MCLVCGRTWFVIQEGARDLPPFTAAAVRFAIAWVIMLGIARPLARIEGGARPGLDLVAITGGLQFATSYAIVYWAETILPSGLTAVLWAVYPLLLGVVSLVMLPGERLGARQWAGLALGFSGIATLFWSDLRVAGGDQMRAGAVLLFSPLAVAIANAYLRPRAPAISAALLNRDGLLFAAVLLSTFAALTERGVPVRWTPAAIGSVVYLAAAGTCLTFTVYFWTLRHLPASTVALTSYVTPVIALLLGVFVRGEPFSLGTLSGTAIVLCGVALARRSGARAAKA